MKRELQEATRMAREAGRIVMSLYEGDVAVHLKGESDPVTEADHRANEYLVAELRRLFPGDGVVAEESPDRSDALERGRCWYVDPLDGTKEFLAKNGEFAIMLGLAVDGEARLGVVYQPAADKLYRGVVGEGAHLERAGGTEELRVSEAADPAALRLVVSRSHRSEATDRIKQRLGIADEASSGSVGLKIGMIAERRADLYVHPSDRSYAWDACGPEAILRAAGGRFADMAGRPFRYGGADLRNAGGILACNAAAFDAVVPVVHEVGRDVGLVG
ncbi:MAG: 3'(2'),5'-bisphosphate nucleotidase CysQ family protein [Myxococcota bacterium]